uniref:Uncharacterized protein n=1 Tax=Anguilla anguilla TaxID=7936 RepID=A0A0E9RCS9_ANGAN
MLIIAVCTFYIDSVMSISLQLSASGRAECPSRTPSSTVPSRTDFTCSYLSKRSR